MLTSCGGGAPPGNAGEVRTGETSGVSGRTTVLRVITVTPNAPLGIGSRSQLQFTATGTYSDNTVQDLTTMVAWTSSDTSIATVSNTPGSIGMITAVSRGYCSISATFGNVSGSTIIGIN